MDVLWWTLSTFKLVDIGKYYPDYIVDFWHAFLSQYEIDTELIEIILAPTTVPTR